jgi:pyruvate dehydrogenase E1 component alpha subunit
MPGVVVDGNDAIAVYEVVDAAIERARNGDGPTLIECKTYRWHPHFEGEADTYRPPEEVSAWREREPIAPYRNTLITQGVFTEEELASIDESIKQELEEAVKFARESPFPEPETALTELWA